MDNKVYWIWLTLTFGPAAPAKWKFLSEFSDVKEACEKTLSNELTPVQKAILKTYKVAKLSECEQLIEYCLNKGIKIYCYDDESFPNRFQSIFNPPSVLFVLGSIDGIDDEPSIAVIGARHPCDYSVRVGSRIAYELASVGTTIVSGFALGIDSVAHKSAIEAKSKTIAVIGCGIEYDYPKENSKFKDLIAQNGAIISEYPPKTKPQPNYFVARNRLIAAISLGVLIIEASTSSGTLNTAGYALSYGKEIFVIPPHDIFDERFRGQANLIRDGATPAFSHTDVMYPYYSAYSHKLSELNFGVDMTMDADENETGGKAKKADKKSKGKIIRRKEKTGESKKDNKNSVQSEIDYSELTDSQQMICNELKNGAMHSDELSINLSLKIEKVLSDLTELEIMGIVEAISGRRYRLINNK